MNRANFLFFLCLFFLPFAQADIISEGQKSVRFCVKITNLDQYPGYSFFHLGSPGTQTTAIMASDEVKSRLSELQIKQNTCFSFYKFNDEYVFAVPRDKFDAASFTAQDLIASKQSMHALSVIPQTDPRTQLTDVYRVSLDPASNSLNLIEVSLESKTIVFPAFPPSYLPRVFVGAALLTLLIESAFLILFFKLRKTGGVPWKSFLLGNFISLPVVWFVLPALVSMNAAAQVLISESFAIGIEFLVYSIWASELSLKTRAFLAVGQNVLSYLVGLFFLSFLFGYA